MLDTVQTFWHGRTLGPVECLMLRSFLYHGHPVHLYTFNAESLGPDVPAGVELKDAKDILSEENIYFYKGNSSLSAFSNDFRFKLLYDRGGVWIDTDVVCLKPMQWLETMDVAIASEYLQHVRGAHATTHLLKLPQGGLIAKRCMEVCDRLKQEVVHGTRTWGLGPDTIRTVVKTMNLRCLPPERTSTCPYHSFKTLVMPANQNLYPERVEDIKADTGVIHLWHEMWRREGVNPDKVNDKSIFAVLRKTYSKAAKQVVLVTGAAGFIGRNLVDRLHDLNRFHIIGMDLLPKPLELNENITWIQGDLTDVDFKSIVDRYSVACIVHLAGASGVRQSDDDPRHYVKNNIDATTLVFDAAKANKVKVIFASSSSVYGDTPPPQREHDATHAGVMSFYALSKMTGEDIGFYHWKRWGVPGFMLRFFTVYGKHGRRNMAVRKFAEAIMQETPITVYGDGTQLRDFTDVRDVCTAIVKCIDDVRGGCHRFNVGAEGKVSVNALIALLEDSIGKKALVTHEQRHPADVEATGACTEHISDYFDWRPCINIQEGVQDFVQWLEATNTADV